MDRGRSMGAKRPAVKSILPQAAAGERALIAALKRRVKAHEVAAKKSILRLGIGDDCAILWPAAGDEIVVTTDLFLEQVHFRRDWHQPEVAGHRCLARGLSDIAAMGATPVAAFLSLALPPELAGEWARRFLSGLLNLARRHHVPLAGGDTAQAPACPPKGRAQAGISQASKRVADVGKARKTRLDHAASGPAKALFTADIVLLGSLPRGRALLRSGATPGDAIYVTGALGGAAAELASLVQDPSRYAPLRRHSLHHPHLFPQPRIQAGRLLRGRASAALDLSDGLSTDLAHLCEESRVAAEIERSLLPVHPLAARAHDSLALALHGGEDYELLFTLSAGQRLPATLAGTPVSRIGTIVAAGRGRPRLTLIESDGTRSRVRNQGWEHFRS